MKRALLSLFALGSLSPVFAQQIEEGHYGRARLDVAYSSAPTTDGGYIITGLTQSQVDSNGDIVVIKVTAHGDTSWSRTFGGPFLEGGNFVMQTTDGGYMVSGHTQDFGAHDCDAFLLKLDQYGANQWIKVYGGDSDDISESVITLSGGGYVIGGMTASYGNPTASGAGINRHIYFIKTTSTGDTVWTKVYAGANSEECYSVANMTGGNILAAGWSNSWGSGENDGWLLCLNSSGDTLWTRFYKAAGDTRLYKILPTADNGFIVTGYTTPVSGGLSQGLAIKLDASGNEVWKKTYTDSSENIALHDVAQLPTGDLMFAGASYISQTIGGYVYLLTTDNSGTMLAEEFCGGINSYANTISVQGNNSYLIAGAAAKYGDPDGDLYYMEMDNTISNHVSTITTGSPRLYPNPVREQPAIIILPASQANGAVHLNITTTDGRCVRNEDNILAKDIVISRNDYTPGMYLFRVTCKDGTVYKGKFVVE